MRTTTLQSADAETSTVQPPNATGVAGVHQAGEKHSTETPSPQSWIAVGDQSTDCASRMRRQVTDGMLLKLTVSISGQQVIALVDSGASRCYMSPKAVTSLGFTNLSRTCTFGTCRRFQNSFDTIGAGREVWIGKFRLHSEFYSHQIAVSSGFSLGDRLARTLEPCH